MAETATLVQFLTFTLGSETFALEVSNVREVLEVIPITRIPKMPDFMSGVINVRGSVVPVIDLRLKLGMTRTEATVNTCIVVLEFKAGNDSVILGTLVDSVQEVLEFDDGHIEPPPRVGLGMRTDFIQGIGKREEKFVIMLDIRKVFSGGELEVIRSAEATGG